jgi:hypothetical protein
MKVWNLGVKLQSNGVNQTLPDGFFNFGVNKFISGVNPTNRWYEVDILIV